MHQVKKHGEGPKPSAPPSSSFQTAISRGAAAKGGGTFSVARARRGRASCQLPHHPLANRLCARNSGTSLSLSRVCPSFASPVQKKVTLAEQTKHKTSVGGGWGRATRENRSNFPGSFFVFFLFLTLAKSFSNCQLNSKYFHISLRLACYILFHSIVRYDKSWPFPMLLRNEHLQLLPATA